MFWKVVPLTHKATSHSFRANYESQGFEKLSWCHEVLPPSCQKFHLLIRPLTDLTRKHAIWKWTTREQEKIEELKAKITSAHELGVPRPHGEIVIIIDASDLGGGATNFQWRSVDHLDIPTNLTTTVVKSDGTFLHN